MKELGKKAGTGAIIIAVAAIVIIAGFFAMGFDTVDASHKV